MKQVFETGAFLALAAGVHVLAFFAMPQQDGLNTGGNGGVDVLTLMAVAPTVEAMVKTWETTPQTATDLTAIDTLTPQAFMSEAPAMAQMFSQDAQVRLAATDPLPDLQVEAETSPVLPVINTETAPPESPQLKPEIKPEPEPKPKPKPQKKPPPKAPKKTESKTGKSNVTSQGRAAQKAAGSGGGKAAGNNGNKSQAAISAGKTQSLMRGWQSKVQRRISQRQHSPRGAFTPSRVVINITVDRAGNVLAKKIAKPSSDPKVNQAALDTISRAGRMPKAPKNLPGSATFTFAVTLVFRK